MESLTMFSMVLLLAASALAIGNIEDCDNGDIVDGNPLGTCACEGHLWVAPGCQEGFFCYNTQANGCQIKCADDEILYTNFATGYWDCRVNGPGKEVIAEGLPDTQALLVCPSGGYDLCPSGDVATTPFPPDEADGNPLGECRCDGELWLAEGCKYGFFCDSAEDIGGQYLSCPNPDEVLLLSLEDPPSWECTTDTATCYGGAILGVNCPMPECEYSKNPFGMCECDQQFFINDECTEGFWCTDNIPDPYLYDGCYQRCYDGQVLQPDFVNKNWTCVDSDEQERCPGHFKLECEETGNFDRDDCDCPDGQLHMSGDCKESFWCRSLSEGGGVPIHCDDEGEIVNLDYNDWSWSCGPDTGNCPGLGGFKAGCGFGNVEQPDLECNFGHNPYGECHCDQQIFINEDCDKGFYCSEHIPTDEDPDFNGCLLACDAGDRIHFDPENEVYECIPRETEYVCPGEFAIDCPNEAFPVDCGCDNELWVNKDCNRAYLCNNENTHGSFSGFFVDCPEGEYFNVDFDNIMDIQCTAEPTVCPGSFHFGCNGGDLSGLFPPETTDDPGNGSSEKIASLLVAMAGLGLVLNL